MDMISNEMLFRGGLTVAGATAALLVIFLVLFAVSGIKLKFKLDEEYGKRIKKKDK